MDWIERLFHVGPDGGGGSLEIGIAAGTLMMIATVIAGRVKMRPVIGRWLARLATRARRFESTPLS